jgi:hypothetical protein
LSDGDHEACNVVWALAQQFWMGVQESFKDVIRKSRRRRLVRWLCGRGVPRLKQSVEHGLPKVEHRHRLLNQSDVKLQEFLPERTRDQRGGDYGRCRLNARHETA